jgi:hypothetical protein
VLEGDVALLAAVVEGVVEVRLALGAFAVVGAELAASDEVGAGQAGVVGTHAEALLAGEAVAFGVASEAVLDDCACGALVVVVDVVPRLACPALLGGVALETLGDEEVAVLALALVREEVVHALFAVVLVKAVLALRQSGTFNASALRRVVLALDALAAPAATLAYLATRDDPRAEFAAAVLEKVVDAVAFCALVLAIALGAVLVEGTAAFALGGGVVEVVGGCAAGKALLRVVAVETALEAFLAEMARPLGGVVAVGLTLFAAFLETTLKTGLELLRALDAGALAGVEGGRVAAGALGGALAGEAVLDQGGALLALPGALDEARVVRALAALAVGDAFDAIPEGGSAGDAGLVVVGHVEAAVAGVAVVDG